MYSEQDIKNLEEIHGFLNEYNIPFHTEYDSYSVIFNPETGKIDPEYDYKSRPENEWLNAKYEVFYVPAEQYPLESKKYGIEGYPLKYFHNRQRAA